MCTTHTHTHTAVEVGEEVEGFVSSRGPLCEPPAWSCMSCDGGLWTLAVVLPFSADFMPLLSFTFTQNKQHRGCRLWELVSLSIPESFCSTSPPFSTFRSSSSLSSFILLLPPIFKRFLFSALFLSFSFPPFLPFLLALPFSPLFSPSSCCWMTFQ